VVEHERQTSLCLINYCSLEQHKCSLLHMQTLLKHPLLQSSVTSYVFQSSQVHHQSLLKAQMICSGRIFQPSLDPRPNPRGRVWGITLLGSVSLKCHALWIQQTSSFRSSTQLVRYYSNFQNLGLISLSLSNNLAWSTCDIFIFLSSIIIT